MKDDFSYYDGLGRLIRVTVVEGVPAKDRRCANCSHFDPHGQGNEVGSCWRYPPTIVPMILPNTNGFTQVEQSRPWVSRTDTCGEWRMIDDRKQEEGTDARPGGAADS